MNKLLLNVLIATLPASAVFAMNPVPEHFAGKSGKLQRTSAMKAAKASVASQGTLFEGFEERSDGFGDEFDEWLPQGWEDKSMVGDTEPVPGERFNMTWRVVHNDSRENGYLGATNCYAYEGNCFAYIQNDFAYGGHTDLKETDEWLITPVVTPEAEDWLYFKLFYFPSWTVKGPDGFNAVNSHLEVHVSADNGSTWTQLWDLIDDEIKGKFTDEELEADLIDIDKSEYVPIYVNISEYVGKQVRFAFRYTGKNGQPLAIDNVAVGVPQPVAKYDYPADAFLQGVSPMFNYPDNPRLLLPADMELTWKNTSEDVLRCEWRYKDADGAEQFLKVDGYKSLTTPAYDFGSVFSSPSLQGFFESRVSEVYNGGSFAEMQFGGELAGADKGTYEGVFGVGNYDMNNPENKLGKNSLLISMHSETDSEWEKILGQIYGALDVKGLGCYFEPRSSAYGLDYVEIGTIVESPINANTTLNVTVFAMPEEEGEPATILGHGSLTGEQINAMEKVDGQFMMRFDLDVPAVVPADKLVLVLVDGFDQTTDDNFVFPFITTPAPVDTKSVFYMYVNNPELSDTAFDSFHNLNYFPVLASGRYLGGLILNIGASYSTMELVNGESYIEAPYTGATHSVKIAATHKPERWAFTADGGATKVDWITHSATYNEAERCYDVTITLAPNNMQNERNFNLNLQSPGSAISFHVKQAGDPSAGVDKVVSGNVVVKLEGTNIVIEGVTGNAEIFNVAGTLMVAAEVEGSAVIDVSRLPSGVYVVCVNGKDVYKIVK